MSTEERTAPSAESTKCPICSQNIAPLNGIMLKAGFLITKRGSIHVTPITAKILKVLIRGPVDINALIELIYSCDTEMEAPDKSILTHICWVRPRLIDLGWRITTFFPSGRGAYYKLERIEEQEDV